MGSNIETLTVGSLSLKYLYTKNFYVKNWIYIYQLVLYSRYPTWNYGSGAFKNLKTGKRDKIKTEWLYTKTLKLRTANNAIIPTGALHQRNEK